METNIWTHWFAPNICFGLYVERCVIVKKRCGLMGRLFGEYKIRTCEGYTGWHGKEELYEIYDWQGIEVN